MLAGVAFALAAGMMWGLVFVAPLLLPEYPAASLSFGRYLAFGVIALPLAWLGRAELARLSRADWIEALKLAAVGNLLYYLLLASAIQRAGGPLPTMIIGTLPVVISICANLRASRRTHQRDGRLPWRRLAPALQAWWSRQLATGRGRLRSTRFGSATIGASRFCGALTAPPPRRCPPPGGRGPAPPRACACA